MDTILITGASGFLGRACCTAFTAAGYPVRALVREPARAQDLQPIARGGIYKADLPKSLDQAAFEGPVAAVIHCAYTTTAGPAKEAQETNLAGTRLLRETAHRHAVPQFVFVSSMAAHAGAQSTYGKTKWRLEQEMTAPEDTIIKPGTILGPGGVFQRTREMVGKLPVVPLLYGDRELQTIWIDDVVEAILSVVKNNIRGEVILAHPQAVTMAAFYRKIADMDAPGKKLLPISGDLALAAVSVTERLGLKLPISRDNLLGIKYLHTFDPGPSLRRLGLAPFSFDQSLARLKAHSAPQSA